MRHIFIGDIHGCADELKSLLRLTNYEKGTDQLYLTGDAFTKGPDPLEVWKTIGSSGAQMVMGNHDDALMERMRAREQGSNESDLSASHLHTLDQLKPVADSILLWLEFLPLAIRELEFTLVHAGINPERGFDRTHREEFLAIRTWPPTGGIEGPRWHDHYEPSDSRTLVFGHDAPGGLILKRLEPEHPPYLVGLDTGCIYGGKLTAWILEEDEFVDVDAKQTYE
jgi:bis(5'-nucleosyl)-tetraphosphatase (symmetrical)